ncbi:MAG: hypothetical protein GDA56_24275 [Hormoscilla sp. GM7CHS1pb]|nr:hypothetical protein [Hormoscilla sp. GM7CHS1pb]
MATGEVVYSDGDPQARTGKLPGGQHKPNQKDNFCSRSVAPAMAETVLERLGEQVDRTEKEIVEAKNNAAAELRSIAAETQAARDDIYKKLALVLPRLTQGAASAVREQTATAADYVEAWGCHVYGKGL